MSKFSFKKTFLFCVSIIFISVTACNKDIAGKFDGTYIGEATIDGSARVSDTFPATRTEITRVSNDSIRLEMFSSSPDFTFTRGYKLRKDGTFGPGVRGNRGDVILYGQEGKFFKDSLFYSFANMESNGINAMYRFKGRRN